MDESGQRRRLVGHLHGTCLDGDPDVVIDGAMINRYVDSPFSFWCDLHAPQDEQDPPDAFLEHLRAAGRQHKVDVVARQYPQAVRVDADSVVDPFRATLEQMVAGAHAIDRPILFFLPDAVSAKPDLLVRCDDHSSLFGDYHYRVKEIKSALKIHAHYRMQAMFENHVMGRVQGYTPAVAHVVDRNGNAIPVAQDEQEVARVFGEVRAVVGGRQVDPVYGGGRWPWESYTNKQVTLRRDASLLPGVGRGLRDALAAHGFKRVEDVDAATPAQLGHVKGIDPGMAPALQRAARSMVSGEPIVFAPAALPAASTEIFLDLEGTSNQVYKGEAMDVDYMIGVLVRKSGVERFLPFLAGTPGEERQMFDRFYRWLETQEDYVLYHWHGYEPSRFKRMIALYGGGAEAARRLVAPLHDLFLTTTRSCVFPTPGNSIKKIAGYLDPSLWSQDDVTGSSSIALYFDYLRDPATHQESLGRIVEYNKADCMALRTVKDWLVHSAQRA